MTVRGLVERTGRPGARVAPGTVRAERKADGSLLEVWLYGEIGFWGTEAIEVARQIEGSDAREITVHLNSPGGDVFDGVAMYNLLRTHQAKVTTVVEGLAASIASLIALAGDEVRMHEPSMLMVHEVWGGCVGNKREMFTMAETLEHIEDATILPAYAAKTGKPRAELLAMVEAETWFSAREAVEARFADAIIEGGAPAEIGSAAARAYGWKRMPANGEKVLQKETKGAKGDAAADGVMWQKGSRTRDEKEDEDEGMRSVARLGVYRARTRVAELED